MTTNLCDFMKIEDYILAKENDLLERYRGDCISRRIARETPLSTQIALLMDRDTKPEALAGYQIIRQQAKDEVDAKIEEFEKELSNG